MKVLKNFIKVAAGLVAIFYLNACADDLNTVGADLIDNNNFDSRLFDNTKLDVSQIEFDKVQTNILPGYLLGVYNDEIFGQTTANILTQISLSQQNPDFGDNVELKEVTLTLPYFSTVDDVTLPFDERTFTLDSIYGNSPIKLSIIRSNFFLRPLDPGTGGDFEDAQQYFSDSQDQIEASLSNTVIFEDDNFLPSNEQIVVLDTISEGDEIVVDTIRLSPALRVPLPLEFFQENIIDRQGDEVLLTNSNFQNFIRGLYFKAEAIGPEGNMIFLNLLDANATINLNYTSDRVDIGDQDGDGDFEEIINEERDFQINFSGIKVNTYSNPFQPNFRDDRIYLKGTDARMAEIEVFADEDQLDSIKDLGWLINEANLTLFVDQQRADNGVKEPERLFIYDLDNNTVLADYSLDITLNDSDALNSRTNHLERLTREQNATGSTTDQSSRGHFYKIRMTNYINDIINNDSVNRRLGLMVSTNINLFQPVDAFKEDEDDACLFPSAGIVTPEGTVLHSNNSTDQDKKLRLQIFFTEPN